MPHFKFFSSSQNTEPGDPGPKGAKGHRGPEGKQVRLDDFVESPCVCVEVCKSTQGKAVVGIPTVNNSLQDNPSEHQYH